MAGKRIRTTRSRTSRRAQRVGRRMSAHRSARAAESTRRAAHVRLRRVERKLGVSPRKRRRTAPKAAPRKRTHSATTTVRSKSGTRRVQVSGLRHSLAELRAKQGSGRRRR